MRQWVKPQKIVGIKRLLRAGLHSAAGLKAAYESGVAFKQEIIATFLVIPLGLFIGVTPLEKIILIGSWLLVLIVELINTALELVVDRISLKIHPLSKKIKDIGSAAVLLALSNFVLLWLIILLG